MLIGKLIKPCKICLYETRKDGGEIESFSLLKLWMKEFGELFAKAIELKKVIERLSSTCPLMWIINKLLNLVLADCSFRSFFSYTCFTVQYVIW